MYRLLFSRESKTIATGYVSCYFSADKKMTHPQLLEKRACTPLDLNPKGFNTSAQLPYGLTPQHIKRAMQDLLDFLGFINGQLFSKSIPRLEAFLMPANFSSLVGEFMNITIPKYCQSIVKNKYHNGHPDLIPKGHFPGDAVQHATEGIEVKGSRHRTGWQGHNPENIWLMVFIFDANSSRDELKGTPPKPFRLLEVLGAQLFKDDWNFSGRSATSRRTITASVTRSGYEKMAANWIYRDPRLTRSAAST